MTPHATCNSRNTVRVWTSHLHVGLIIAVRGSVDVFWSLQLNVIREHFDLFALSLHLLVEGLFDFLKRECRLNSRLQTLWLDCDVHLVRCPP